MVQVKTGYALVLPDLASPMPEAGAIFQFREDLNVISEAGVAAAAATTHALMFVDNSGTRTGMALASPGNPAHQVQLRLLDGRGAFLAETQLTIEEEGHSSLFIDEAFPQMPLGFTGLLDISSDQPVALLALKLTTNQRGDPVLSSMPVADAARITQSRLLVFPQFGFGGGLATRLILLNPNSEDSAVRLRFFSSPGGQVLDLPLGDRFESEFDFEISSGAGLQLRPGSTAAVARIIFDSFNPLTREAAVDKGSTIRLRPRVVDEDGNPRDDFALTFSSLTPDVATVSAQGLVQGIRKGFATIVIEAGGVQTSGTIAVAEVTTGALSGEVTGVVQDLAGRIYLSQAANHVILRTDSISSPPRRFAGVAGDSGLADGDRLDQARFNHPSDLALDLATGSLYVADSGNHIIRRIRVDGVVETIAGTGQAGAEDGMAGQASFSNPQGIALDNLGHLWVADTGTHTVRRIDLAVGHVTTIAGMPGQPGSADGMGASARFSSPIGIALEDSSREPLVSLLVADSGSGLIRRVLENGSTESLGGDSLGLSAGGRPARIWGRAANRTGGAPLIFRSPAGLAVDPSGNIYVAETEAGRIAMILRNGSLAEAAQPELNSHPRDVFIPRGGTVLVADRSARQACQGPPEITSVTPELLNIQGGEKITVKGTNFSPDSFIVLGGLILEDINFENADAISFEAPPIQRPGHTHSPGARWTGAGPRPSCSPKT